MSLIQLGQGIFFAVATAVGITMIIVLISCIHDGIKNFFIANELHKCKSCKKYARFYQMELAYWKEIYAERKPPKKYDVCPHCKKHYTMKESNDQFPWLKKNPDCFKINLWQHIQNEYVIFLTKRDIEALKSMKAFTEYYDLQKDPPKATSQQEYRDQMNPPMPHGVSDKDGLVIYNYPDDQHDFLKKDGIEYVRDHEDMAWLPVRRIKAETDSMQTETVDSGTIQAAKVLAFRRAGINLEKYKKNQSG